MRSGASHQCIIYSTTTVTNRRQARVGASAWSRALWGSNARFRALAPKAKLQDEATAGTECLSLDFSGPSAAWGRTPAGAGAGARGTWLKLNKHFSARQASHAYH